MTNRNYHNNRGGVDETMMKDLDTSILQARQELQRLRKKRREETIQRQKELRYEKQKCVQAKKNLQTKLKTARPSISLLMSSLRKHHQNVARENSRMGQLAKYDDSIPSQYILQKQTLWMTNMMYAYFVLPQQRKLVENQYEDLERLVMKQRVDIFLELDDKNQEILQQVTKVAEEYSSGYDENQSNLNEMKTEIKRLSSLLIATTTKTKDIEEEKQQPDDDSTAFSSTAGEQSDEVLLAGIGSFETYDTTEHDDDDDYNNNEEEVVSFNVVEDSSSNIDVNCFLQCC